MLSSLINRFSSSQKILNNFKYVSKRIKFIRTLTNSAQLSELKLTTVCSGISKDLKKPSTKRNTIGDDAWFVVSQENTIGLGVADGVGGWRDVGVDPSLFSSQLMYSCKKALEQEKERLLNEQAPTTILDQGYKALLERKDDTLIGSSTACILLFNRKSNVLYSANLGDSGFAIIRENQIVHRSFEQQHYFNCPFQITVIPEVFQKESNSDLPSAAEKSSFKLCEGDFVVLATDGLWDNLSDTELLSKLDDFKVF